MTPCEFCSEVHPAIKRHAQFQCPFCGRYLAHYLPTLEEIHRGAAQIRYENEVQRLSDPDTTHYLPW